MASKTATLSATAHADVLAALALGNIPDVHWLPDDDLCDCTFQRIGFWTNPYLGKTLRVRLCCIWAEIYKMFPQFVQDIDAYYDSNTHTWVKEPQDWDSAEMNMPLAIWYRQLAQREGRPVSEVRAEYSERKNERPKATGKVVEKVIDPAVVEASRNERLRLMGWL